ncbi:hypothetical protein M0R45_017503 [Rubus argutus]|uniref:LysM domain-containing protein n=1 Tax=Rubus argutus TaxID=59490 RepID=A0AAW1XWG5_RUBAR
MSNNKRSMFLNVALLLCLFLIISSVESRKLGNGNGKPQCDTVYGIKPANQCTGIMEAFDLSEDEFFAINPNLNCNAIFVGQWICIDGSA